MGKIDSNIYLRTQYCRTFSLIDSFPVSNKLYKKAAQIKSEVMSFYLTKWSNASIMKMNSK